MVSRQSTTRLSSVSTIRPVTDSAPTTEGLQEVRDVAVVPRRCRPMTFPRRPEPAMDFGWIGFALIATGAVGLLLIPFL